MIFTVENNNLAIFGKTLDDVKNKFIDFTTVYEQYGLKGKNGALSTLFNNKAQNIVNNDLLVQFEDFKEIFNSTSLSAEAVAEKMGHVDKQIINYAKTCKNGELTTKGFTTSLKGMTTGAKVASIGMKGLSLALNAALNIGAMLALTAVVSTIQQIATYSDRLAEKASEVGSAFKESQNDIESYKAKLDELQLTIHDSSSSYEEVTQARKQLMTIQDELIDKYGDEKGAINAITDAVRGQTEELNKLTDAQYQSMINEFNKSEGWTDSLRSISGSNFDKMLEQMEKGEYKVTFAISGNEEFDKLLQNKFGAELTGDRDMMLTGNLQEVYDKLLQIQKLSKNYETGNFFDLLSNSIVNTQEKLENYQEIYSAYVLKEKILDSSEDNNFDDYYKKALDAYTEYNEMVEKNGLDSDEAKHAADEYVSIINDAIKEAGDDTGVVDFFKNLNKDLVAEVNSNEFEINFTANTDDMKNDIINDLKDLKDFDTDEKLKNFSIKAATNEQKKAYTDLDIYAQKYNISIEQLIDSLTEMGMIKPQIKIDFLDKLVPSKQNLSAGFEAALEDAINDVDVKSVSEWFDNKLTDEEQKLVNSSEFIQALQDQKDLVLKEQSKTMIELQQNLESEYQKVQNWGLDDYASQIKNGTIQSVFGNVDMDKRTIITWSEELKKTYQDALKSWNYDPEIGTIDTVFGGSNRFGEDLNGTGWEIAFTPILPDGTFLSKDTVESYINNILEQAYANDGQVTSEELAKIDAQGKQVGNTFVHGIFAGMDSSQNYDNNGNWAETIGRLMHFSGDFGAVNIAKDAINNLENEIAKTSITADDCAVALDNLKNKEEQSGSTSTSFSDKLLNSKEAISTFTSSVESAYSAYSKLMKSNLSSSDIISSIQSINDAASNMGDSINWDFLDGQENSLELLGTAIEDISRKYAESVLSGAGIDVDSKFGEMLANNIIQAQKSAIELENLNSGLDSLQSAYSSLTDIVDSYNKTGYFTFDQLQSLLELEPQYLACLIDENGQLQLNEQAMTALANQRLNDAEAQAVQQAITELGELALQDEKTAAEENGNAFYNAISKIAGYNQELSTMIANATVGAAQIRDLNAAIQGAESRGASDDQIQTVLDNLKLKLNAIDSARAKVNSGGLGSVAGSKASKSGSKKEEDKWLEEYKNKLSALQDELDKELINEREFYDKSEALMNEYLKDSPEHIKKYEEEIASAEKSLHGDWANAYQAEHDAIEDLYNDGKISVKEYYSQLKRLANGYGFTGEAVGKYGKYTKEAAEAQKELNEIAKDALDNAIKGATYLIDKQIAKYNKLKDAADESYNAQIKALDMQIKGLDDQIDSIDDLIDELEDQADAIDNQIDLIEDQTDAIDDQIDAIDDQIESIDNQIKAIENEIENYDRLIDEKQKIIDQMQDENDERDRQMKLQKAQAELDKALNNNTTSTFSGGQWTYKNNEDEVSTARENVRDAQNDINVAEIQKEIDLLNEGRDALQAQIDLFEKQKEELQSQIDLFEKQKEALQEQIDLFEKQKEAIQDQIDSYEKQKEAIQEQIDLIEKQKEAIQESMEKSDEYFEKMIKSIEETKSRWEELSELDTNTKMMQDMEDVFNKLGYTAQDVLNMSDKTFAEFKDKYLNYMMSVKGESDSVRQALSTMANVSDIQWLDDYLARTGVGLGNIASIDLTGTVGSIDGVNDGLHIVKDSSGDTKDSIITGMGEVSDTSTDTANTIITGMDDVTVASNVTSESVSADLGTVKESAYDTSKAINGGKDAKSKSDSLTTALKDTKDTASITVPAVSQMFDNVTSSVKDSTKAVDDLRAAIERLNSTKVTAPGVSVNSKTFSVPKHAKGAKEIEKDELAWTQENGAEIIASPTRKAVFTPLNAGDTVFTNEMSENLWEWGKLNPNFLMDHMEVGTGVNATKTTINNNNSSVVMNVSLNLPNVTNDSGVEYIQKELTKLSNNLKVGKYQYFNKI